MEDGNAFVPDYIEDYNRRFERAPHNPHDAHRPMQDGEDLTTIFSWQEERPRSAGVRVGGRREVYTERYRTLTQGDNVP
jgi:hypothetical protein